MERFDSDQINYITAAGLPDYLDTLASECSLNVFTDLSYHNLDLQLGKSFDVPPEICGIAAELLHMLVDMANEL